MTSLLRLLRHHQLPELQAKNEKAGEEGLIEHELKMKKILLWLELSILKLAPISASVDGQEEYQRMMSSWSTVVVHLRLLPDLA